MKQILKQYFLFSLLSSLFIVHSFIAMANDGDEKITITGVVLDNEQQFVIGASVESELSKASTFTDEDGKFELDLMNQVQLLTITGSGVDEYQIEIDPKEKTFTIKVKNASVLQEFELVKRRKATEIEMFRPIKTENIGMKELAKAACCNLSESFETTPSVDAGFTDAVSGYKQISMLGLSGPNVAFTRENIPDIRGLAAITGLTFTPGPWVESIQLSKGTGSVVNGYEGVAGQINIELHKPKEKDGIKLLLNAYQSAQGRSEVNAVYNTFINRNLNTSILFHTKSNWLQLDDNEDNFLDQPLGNTYLLGNRWMYVSDKGLEVQVGVKGTLMELWGGQKDYKKNQEINTLNPWGFYNNTKRAELWAKIGKMYAEKPYQSMGLQLSGILHQQEAQYGLRNYNGKQNSLYANYIFQSILGTSDHVYKVGASFQYDDYDETFANTDYARKEYAPGVFAEYSYSHLEKFNVVMGLRADYNNLYGVFATPRIHIRYAPEENLTFRASIGRAQRTVNVFSENIGFMASNRAFVLAPNSQDKAYGLQPEVAWNMGANATKKFILNYRDGSFSVDYYYTHFENMIIGDIESYNQIKFYNLNGKSYAHSFQAQLDYEVLRKWDVRMAYRFYDVKATYEGKGLLEKPLVAGHRFFINTAYETNNNWMLDFTANWSGAKRMPEHLKEMGAPATAAAHTPSYWIFNTQISKSWKQEKWKLYGGVENILGTMQDHLILGKQNPYGAGFDAGLVWGSGMGRNIYMGLNYKL